MKLRRSLRSLKSVTQNPPQVDEESHGESRAFDDCSTNRARCFGSPQHDRGGAIKPSDGGLRFRYRLFLLLLTALLLFPRIGWGQDIDWNIPDSAAPLVPFYGFDNDEFIIGGVTTKWATTPAGYVDQSYIWPYLDSLGLNLWWFTHNNPSDVTSIYNSQFRQQGVHRSWTNAALKVENAGRSKEIRFYPFDSVQSPYNVWQFLTKNGGETDTNSVELNDLGKPVLEQVFENLSDTGLIASTLVLEYISQRDSTRVQQLNKFSEWFKDHRAWNKFTSQEPRTYYTALIGHLFTGGSAADTDTIFTVAIYHEMQEGKEYLDDSFQTATVGSGGLDLLVDSFAVTKAELTLGFPDTVLARYRTIVRATDLRYRLGNTSKPGPLHPSQPEEKEQAIDIRVYWTGKEKAALHAVALRDSIANLILGTGTPSDNFRASLMADAKSIMLGNATGSIANLRTDMVAMQSGEEARHHPMDFASFEALNRMMRDTFNLPRWRVANGQGANPQPGDSIGCMEFEKAGQTFHLLTTAQAITNYNYFNAVNDTVEAFSEPGVPSGHFFKDVLEIPHHIVPSFKQMNGGRFHLPELLDLDSVGIPAYDATLEERIEGYEETLQRLMFGRFDPDRGVFYDGRTKAYPNNLLKGIVGDLGAEAILSRKTGRRLIPMPGPVTHVGLRDGYTKQYVVYDTTYIEADSINDADTLVDSTVYPPVYITDTLVSHTATESELFAVIGLDLTYGARGVIYWQTRGSPAVVKSKVDPNFWVTKEQCCWGNAGHFTRDSVQNTLRPMSLYDEDLPMWSSSAKRAEIPDFYVGWFDGVRAIKTLNRRLKIIGNEMMKYRWRNSYSIHFTTLRPGSARDTVYRPIPSTEIITEVRSRSPFKAQPDSLYKTYVEMGLFDKVTDSTDGVYDPLKDRHIVYLTNRRSFRKPIYGCFEDTCTGATPDTTVNILDTLAGTRVITCRLNLQHPDTTGYNLWRVREIKPDSTALPHAPNLARHTLDTVVSGDSVFALVLGPGMSTAVEISPTFPDTSLLAGDLRWPGQRKLFFDGKRYHAVVHTTRPLPFPMTGTEDVIAWRLSYIMDDTSGAIRWLPYTYVISDALKGGDTARTQNRFPSFTFKRILDTVYVTFVWSCDYADTSSPGDREIVMRNFKGVDLNTGSGWYVAVYFSNLTHVDWHKGFNAEQWGTPVVGYSHGGVHYAWSDSVLGIVGRLQPLTLSTFGGSFGTITFSPPDSISWAETQSIGLAAQYPSIVPLTPVSKTDSTIGITWRQPRTGQQDIRYNRLQHTATDAMVNVNPSSLSLAPWYAQRWYPSIDIISDTVAGISREGITWEDDLTSLKVIYFQSLLTPSSGITAMSNRAYYVVATNGGGVTWPNGEIYPQTSYLGEHDTSLAGALQFAVGYQVPTTPPDLWQTLVDWDSTTFKTNWPQQYTLGGRYPNVALNHDETWRRFAILYQANGIGGSDSTLRTSRQFFAKHSRPVGYTAQGRDTRFRIDDSTGTGFHILLYDPWFADANSAAGLSMVKRGSELQVVDSVEQLQQLFRTVPFHTSDSVTLGCYLYAKFYGDSSVAIGDRVDAIVEVVDSASGDVVAELDSISVSGEGGDYSLQVEKTVDLLSGTYYLRLRFGSDDFPSDQTAYDYRYPVAEVAGWIPNPVVAKGVRRIDGEVGNGLRISAQPNPFTGETEFRFSISRGEHVTLSVFDALGREVSRLVESEFYERGRYAVDFDGSQLRPGTYIVELKTLNGRVVAKIIVQR